MFYIFINEESFGSSDLPGNSNFCDHFLIFFRPMINRLIRKLLNACETW